VTASRCARLVAWGNAWLTGQVGLDDVLTVVQDGDEPHEVRFGTDPESHPLGLALGRLRFGADGWRLTLPVPGDVSSLPGPAGVNQQALTAGEAALLAGNSPVAVIPTVHLHGTEQDGYARVVSWQVVDCDQPKPLTGTVRSADRELTEAVREATRTLLDLDVAGAGSEVLDELHRARQRPVRIALPSGYPDEAHSLLSRCEQLTVLLDLAERDAGAAISGAQLSSRGRALVELAGAVRRAREMAYSSGGGRSTGQHPMAGVDSPAVTATELP
jgi:hypothetical protein